MNFTKKYLEGIIWNQLGKSFEFFLSFLTTVIIAKKLVAVDFGLYSLTINFAMFVIFLISLGLPEILNVYIPKHTLIENEKSFLFKHILKLRIFINLLVCLVILLFSQQIASYFHFEGQYYYIKIISVYIFLYSLFNTLVYFLIGNLELKIVNIIRVFIQLFNLTLSILLLNLGYGIKELLFIFTFSSLCGVLILYKIVSPHLKKIPKVFDLKPIYKFGFTTWITQLSNFFSGKHIIIILLGLFIHDKAMLGYCDIGITLAQILAGFMIMGFEGILQTAFSRLASSAIKAKEKLGLLWKLQVKFDTLLSVPILVFSLYYGKLIILSIYSQKYYQSVNLFYAAASLFILIRLSGSGGAMAAPLFYAINKERVPLYYFLGGGILNILLALLLIPIFKSLGGILAMGIASLITSVIGTKLIIKYTGERIPYLYLFKLILASIIAIIATSLFKVKDFYGLAVMAIFFALVFIFVFCILRPFDLQDKLWLEKINPRLARLLNRFEDGILAKATLISRIFHKYQ